MPLVKKPESEKLVVGERYVITGISSEFTMQNGGKGLVLNTTAGLRRTTSKVVIRQLTEAGVSFPVEATLTQAKNKAGAAFQILKEDA